MKVAKRRRRLQNPTMCARIVISTAYQRFYRPLHWLAGAYRFDFRRPPTDTHSKPGLMLQAKLDY